MGATAPIGRQRRQAGYNRRDNRRYYKQFDPRYRHVLYLGLGGQIFYPLYSYITQKRREKLAPEILRLTDELTRE